MPLNRHKCVAVAKVLVIRRLHALLLLAHKRPQFIKLDIAAFDGANPGSHDALAFLASEHQEVQDRADIDAGNPGNARFPQAGVSGSASPSQ